MREWIRGWRMISGKDGKEGKGGMAFRRRVIAALLSFLPAFPFLPALPAQAQSLAKRIDARLDAIPFNRQLWGIAMVDEGGRLVYGRNESRLFVPASNAKLVVSAVASALLPPDWRVKTSLYGGPIVGGVLQGDLVLYGRGDPTMNRRCYATDTTITGVCDADPFARLRQLVDALRAKGVRAI